MATLITEPANSNPATIDWQALIAKTTKVMGECAKFRLTNMTADTEPQMEAGSRFEVNGSYYECASVENITGWSSMGLNRFVYVYATPSGGSVTFSYSETAPTFDSAKGGWFNATARALFKIYKTTATGWTAKRYVDMVEGVSGNWTNILSRDVGTDWSTAMLNSAGAGMLAELIKIGLLTGLNADLLDGYHAGNGSGKIPISNGTVCTNLNSYYLEGKRKTYFTNAKGTAFLYSSGIGGSAPLESVLYNTLYASGVSYLPVVVSGVLIKSGVVYIVSSCDLRAGIPAGSWYAFQCFKVSTGTLEEVTIDSVGSDHVTCKLAW